MKKSSLKFLFGIIVLLILVNALASRFYTRVDFTVDKKYTLSATSLDVVKSIEQPLVIEVFLTGDLPAEFKRLQSETRYMLEEFQAYNSNIKFRFSNPLEGEADAMEIANQFYANGMSPETLNIRENGKVTERLIFPWAIARYAKKEVSLPLLQKTLSDSNAEITQKSIESLEYAFVDAITKLTRERSKKIAIVKGQGELEDKYLADFLTSLKDYYLIAPFTLDSVGTKPIQTLEALKRYDLIINANPKLAFSDEKLFAIDQYIMNGGKALWLTQHVSIEKDSLYNSSQSALAFPNDLNLHALFFNYGIRINPQLINDLYSAPIVLASGSGNSTQLTRFPWFYDPLGEVGETHPITSKLNQVRFEFANPIDTLKSSLKKTVLLQSSKLSRKVGVPSEINLSEISQEPDPQLYTSGKFPMAVLVEGEFNSAFKAKLKPFDVNSVLDKSPYTQQVFISDGNLIKNQIQSGNPLELGFDRYTGLTYGNKRFLLNTVNYLLGDEDLVSTRNKSIQLNEMDLDQLQDQERIWQILNITIPVLLILSFGGLLYIRRKRKYASFKL